MDKDKALKEAEQSIKDLMHALAEDRITGDDYRPEELEALATLDAIKEALAQPPLPVQEPIADVRGLLAARLTCWHRLTGVESDELVALFQAQPVQPAVPLKKPPTPWYESARISDYNKGWDECIDAMMAALKEKNFD